MRSIPILAALALACPLSSQTLTTEVVASGFSRPVWCGSPPGDERIFVVEQNSGEILIIDGGGSVLATPFLDIGPKITNGGEQGLLGLAFHPKFKQNGYFFVNYTSSSGGRTVIERYQVSGDPNVADAGSALEIFSTGQPFANHNAGDLAFSPIDGYLYIPIGDGGDANDPGCRAQKKDGFKGKMLRLDVDNASVATPYEVPADNPFVGDPDYNPEIWSLGWRNPWRFSFDRLTGDMYVGDVGQFAREELDFEPALAGGRNYGWPAMEGLNCISNNLTNCVNKGYDPPACFDAEYADPVFTYSTITVGCSVVGGAVYRGCKLPSVQGTYFFADWCSGRFWSLEMVGGVATNVTDRTAEFSASGNSPSDFGEDGQGELLIANHGTGSSGRISRIVAVTPPSIVDCDANDLDDDCEMATFAWADMDASGDLDACEALHVDTDVFCLSVGGEQTFELHAGAGHGGEFYLVLGSFAGTAPGLNFGPVTLPLNLDFYLGITASQAGVGPFVNTVGALDPGGNATASFAAGPGLPSAVAGLTANHAYLLFDGGGSATFSSNFTGLRFEP